MRLLLHAVTTTEAAEAAAAPPRGLRGQPLTIVRHGQLSAYATCFDLSPDKFGRADLLSQHDIITTLAQGVDSLLPARFPTWFADDAALQGELKRRHADLSEALERVRGRVEIALTAAWTTAEPAVLPPSTEITPGRRYLLERQQEFGGADRRRVRGQELADQTERLVADDLVEIRHHICPSPSVALSSAVLVPRGSAENVMARLARAEQDVRILVNGPWPPYTFANVV